MAPLGPRWSSGACILLLTATCWRDVDVEGLAIKQTFYVDDTCEVEMSHTLLFGALSVDSSGNVAIGECNQQWSAVPGYALRCMSVAKMRNTPLL